MLYNIEKQFQTAEKEIKQTELTNRNIVIPAINELRYAGHHLLKGLLAPSLEERVEQYLRASRHCQRARYDAIEARLWYILDKFKDFQDDYRKVSITPVWQDYGDHLQSFDSANSLLNSVVKSKPEDIDDRKDNREELLVNTLEACEKLEPIVAYSDRIRIELDKLIDAARTADLQARQQARNDIRMLKLTLLAFLVTVLVFLFGDNIASRF
ncbi:MAG: hypothetical protein HQL89_14325 [Magnetococcales bacterium]|nr:hypothetical protein [Magnetococcales bacterium]